MNDFEHLGHHALAAVGSLAEKHGRAVRELETLRRRVIELELKLAGRLPEQARVPSVTVTPHRPIHVVLLGLAELYSPRDLDPLWDFGDDTGPHHPHRSRPGFNAAHRYAEPGTYTVTLDGEPYASVVVRPDPRQAVAVVDERSLRRVLTAGGIAELPAGEIVVHSPIAVGSGAVLLGHADGSTLRAAANTSAILTLGESVQVNNVTVRDVTFDGSAPPGGGRGGADALRLANAADVAVIGCRAVGVSSFVVANFGAEVDRLLVQDCVASGEEDVRAYFVGLFGRASDVAIYGNVVANSTTEHCVRLAGDRRPEAGTVRVAVVGNSLTNLDRREEGVAWDTAKGTLVMQHGAFGYAANNTLTGPSGAGPLGGADGEQVPEARWRHAVWVGNTMAGRWQADHGLEHARFEANTVVGPDTPGNMTVLEIKSSRERRVIDLTLRGNMLSTPFRSGKAILVWPSDDVRFEANVLRAGEAEYPHGSVPLLSFPQGLPDGFASIGNAWPLPPAGWPAGGPHAALVGDQNQESNYLSPAEWAALPQTKEDRFD
jgi:hypothetical protein